MNIITWFQILGVVFFFSMGSMMTYLQIRDWRWNHNEKDGFIIGYTIFFYILGFTILGTLLNWFTWPNS